MAKIQNVDYLAMPNNAKQMRSCGQQLNTEVTNAYNSVNSMHSSWYGKRYNELVTHFNNMIPQINEMLQLVVTDIPVSLEKVANNYSQADRGSNATTVENTTPKKITNITIHNDVGMKFITANVQEVQTKVSKNFKNAKDQMNKISTEYNKVKWTSEASEAFKNKFNKLKTDITKSFDEIEKQFTNLMNQTKEDIQKAETANTVQ